MGATAKSAFNRVTEEVDEPTVGGPFGDGTDMLGPSEKLLGIDLNSRELESDMLSQKADGTVGSPRSPIAGGAGQPRKPPRKTVVLLPMGVVENTISSSGDSQSRHLGSNYIPKDGHHHN